MKLTAKVVVAAILVTLALLPAGRAHAQKQRRGERAVPEPARLTREFRKQILTTPPKELGFGDPGATYKAYGVLMETGHPAALVTLVSMRDGNASLYLGDGGAIVGGVGHESVRKAAVDFVEESERHLTGMRATKSFPYPAVGRVKFYVLTFDGVVTVEADEDTLGEGQHALSPLFHKGQEVLTRLRQAAEDQDSGLAKPESARPDWVVFTPKDGGFSVMLPGKPQQRAFPHDTKEGRTLSPSYELAQGDFKYVITYADNLVTAEGAERDKLLSMAAEAGITGAGGTVASNTPITLDGSPGREVKGEVKGFSFRGRVYLVGRRIYTLILWLPPDKADSEEAARFFNSFKIVARQ